MNTRFKVFACYNILQYLCDVIHVLIFATVSKYRKSPKLTNIVILQARPHCGIFNSTTNLAIGFDRASPHYVSNYEYKILPFQIIVESNVEMQKL